jgi:MOSC domain-containing protein YiiM
VPKRPVLEAEVTAAGVEGDRQRDLRYHGGPERAVSLYSVENIRGLRDEGHQIDVGTTGENLTVAGLDWATLGPGTLLNVGPVRLEITKHAHPCSNIEGSFAGGAIARMSDRVHPGWSRLYARVLEGGRVKVGDPVAVVSARD